MKIKHFFTVFCLIVMLNAGGVFADTEPRSYMPPPKPQILPGETPETPENSEHAPAPQTSPNDPSRLNAGDHLRIYVFGVPDLTGEFEVDPRGMITMPLIGELQAQGLDKNELQAKITKFLIDGQYFNDPKVTVEIIALQPFYILGEVNSPGSYPYVADLDVFKAIAIAGGYTPRASKEKITIIRKVHNEKTKIKATEDTPLLPGDSIKVEERFF